MAIQTDIRPGGPRFAGLPSGGDRAKAFRAAQRHSALVRLLRLLLPMSAIGAVGLYFLPSKLSVQVKGGEATIDSINVISGGLKMVNPRIKGVNEKYGVYDIRAENATRQLKDPDLMNLNAITAEITSKTGELTTLTAPTGIYQAKQEELTFDHGVVIGGDGGISGTLKTATAFMQGHMLVSHDPVDLSLHGTNIQAQNMTLYSSEGRAVFEGNVKVHMERQAKGAGKHAQ
jgi:lipopolysaccharide export system protein LptC